MTYQDELDENRRLKAALSALTEVSYHRDWPDHPQTKGVTTDLRKDQADSLHKNLPRLGFKHSNHPWGNDYTNPKTGHTVSVREGDPSGDDEAHSHAWVTHTSGKEAVHDVLGKHSDEKPREPYSEPDLGKKDTIFGPVSNNQTPEPDDMYQDKLAQRPDRVSTSKGG